MSGGVGLSERKRSRLLVALMLSSLFACTDDAPTLETLSDASDDVRATSLDEELAELIDITSVQMFANEYQIEVDIEIEGSEIRDAAGVRVLPPIAVDLVIVTGRGDADELRRRFEMLLPSLRKGADPGAAFVTSACIGESPCEITGAVSPRILNDSLSFAIPLPDFPIELPLEYHVMARIAGESGSATDFAPDLGPPHESDMGESAEPRFQRYPR